MLLSYTKKDGSTAKMRLKATPRSVPVTIGRGTEATIVIDNSKISRIHSSILFWDDMFVIRDVNSSNGTLVNGTPIQVTKLNAGDVIKVGDTEIAVLDETAPSDKTSVSEA